MSGHSLSNRLSLPLLAGCLFLLPGVGANILSSHSAWAGECETPTAYENPDEREYGSKTKYTTNTHANGPWDCESDRHYEIEKKVKISIKKVAYGGSGKFQFHLSGAETSEKFMLSHDGETSFHLKPGTYAITEVDIPKGWSLDRIDCGKGKRTGNRIMVKLDPKMPMECVFTNRKDDDPDDPGDPDEPKRFVKRRLDNLVSHEPDRARMLRRLQEHQQQSLKDTPLKLAGTAVAAAVPAKGRLSGFSYAPYGVGMPPSSTPFPRLKPLPGDTGESPDAQSGRARGQPLFDTLTGYAEQLSAGNSQLRFGTSLSQIYALAQQAKAQEQQRKTAGSGFNFTGQSLTTPNVRPRPGFDVWVEGQASRYDDDIGGIDREGRFGVLYVGADYVIAPGILVGGLVQFDNTKEDLNGPGETGEIEGKGWMIGPYFGMLLANNLMLDVRAAWGRSDNDIVEDDGATGPNSASFDTTRWLVTAALTGSHYHGPWRISPRLAVAYGREQFDTFTNSAGTIVDGDEVTLGRVTGTIEVGYRMVTASGTRIEPHASITGLYNFKDEDLLINGVVVEESKSRAKVEAGVLISLPNGWGLRAAGHYDGLGGDDFESYGGGLWVNIPLSRPR